MAKRYIAKPGVFRWGVWNKEKNAWERQNMTHSEAVRLALKLNGRK